MNKHYILIPSALILLTIVLYQAGISSEVFLDKPTFFSSILKDQKDVQFPDITACLKVPEEVCMYIC